MKYFIILCVLSLVGCAKSNPWETCMGVLGGAYGVHQSDDGSTRDAEWCRKNAKEVTP